MSEGGFNLRDNPHPPDLLLTGVTQVVFIDIEKHLQFCNWVASRYATILTIYIVL